MAEKKLTQLELAARAKVSMKTVSTLIRPAHVELTRDQLQMLPYPTILILHNVAITLGVQCWQLLHPSILQARMVGEVIKSVSTIVLRDNEGFDTFGGSRVDHPQYNEAFIKMTR